jgi:hypothetical protein
MYRAHNNAFPENSPRLMFALSPLRITELICVEEHNLDVHQLLANHLRQIGYGYQFTHLGVEFIWNRLLHCGHSSRPLVDLVWFGSSHITCFPTLAHALIFYRSRSKNIREHEVTKDRLLFRRRHITVLKASL